MSNAQDQIIYVVSITYDTKEAGSKTKPKRIQTSIPFYSYSFVVYIIICINIFSHTTHVEVAMVFDNVSLSYLTLKRMFLILMFKCCT